MNNDSPPILVLSRKKPHLILFLILTILSGLSFFAGGSVSGELPNWLVRSWSGFLLVSGSAALIAHLQRWDRERGMHAERGALSLQSGAVLIYGALLPVYVGWSAPILISVFAAIAWAAANLWEVWLITADLKMINAVRAITPVDPVLESESSDD